jgi:hypothetical protein
MNKYNERVNQELEMVEEDLRKRGINPTDQVQIENMRAMYGDEVVDDIMALGTYRGMLRIAITAHIIRV